MVYVYYHVYTNTLCTMYTPPSLFYTHTNTLYSIHSVYSLHIQIKQSSEGGGKERVVWSPEMYPHHLMPIITPGIVV